jgi:hypothetical protein
MIYNDPTDDGKPARTNAEVVKEAYDRFLSCRDWQGVQDERYREDIKFANGDARNAWQWPEQVYKQRTGGESELPCITIPSTRTHNDLVINAMAKNNFSAKIRPVGGKASYKSAQVFETLIRRTLYISRYSSQKRKCIEQQVDGGIGYILLETKYVSERSFDQEIFLKASRDATGVYLDPWIRDPDGLDANFGFVFEFVPREEFNRKYPNWSEKVGNSPLDSTFQSWMTEKEICVCKYYRKAERSDTLIGWTTLQGAEKEMLASEIKEESGKDILDALLDDIKEGRIDGRTRKVENNVVQWFLIAGNKVVDKGDWAGKYIPILRCPGREVVIDKMLDRKGLTRVQMDAQRMLNWGASIAVQTAAFEPKAGFIAPARSVEGQEQWKTFNINGFPVLLYNDIDDEAPTELQRVEPPQRIEQRQSAGISVEIMQSAERWQMMSTGQFQAQMGENDTQSAASGKAINERQQQGDVATYHFVEHHNDMERALGIQLLDLYPKIYDTKRALQVMGADGKKYWLTIDPQQAEAVQELQEAMEDEEAVKMAFNPGVGEHECISDPGPDYATQRQEAWNAYSLIMQQNNALLGVAGDLLFKFGDFPGAEEFRQRLQKEIKALKPYLFDDKAEPQLMQAQQQIQRLTGLATELQSKLALKEIALKGKDEKRDIEASRAETDRLKVEVDLLKSMLLQPDQQQALEHEIMKRTHDASMQMIVDANAAELQPTTQTGESE